MEDEEEEEGEGEEGRAEDVTTLNFHLLRKKKPENSKTPNLFFFRKEPRDTKGVEEVRDEGDGILTEPAAEGKKMSLFMF